MATTPTNKPIPSEDPRDLKFNAGKIDEFVTSLARQYFDRFGNRHYTIEGLKQLFLEHIYNLGWNLAGSFQGGGTVTSAGDLLQDKSTNIWYRWDDLETLPKTVPAGSTPASAGGTGEGKWQPVDVADVLRKDLASSADDKGDNLITVKLSYPGAVSLTQHDNNALFINVRQFGSIGDGTYHPLSERYASLVDAQAQYTFVTSLTQSIDWAAWQAALNTGKVVYGTDNAYVITDTLTPVSGGGIIGLGVGKWVSGYTCLLYTSPSPRDTR